MRADGDAPLAYSEAAAGVPGKATGVQQTEVKPPPPTVQSVEINDDLFTRSPPSDKDVQSVRQPEVLGRVRQRWRGLGQGVVHLEIVEKFSRKYSRTPSKCFRFAHQGWGNMGQDECFLSHDALAWESNAQKQFGTLS